MSETVERDPRVIPKIGDLLARSTRAIKAGHNTYTRIVRRRVTFVGYNPFVCRSVCGTREINSSLKQWRKWTATAEVISRGPDHE
jgi:hypothetical protein